jgi:hypothetical protein
MDERLAKLAECRVRDGELPGRVTVTTFGGSSNGASCSLCRDPLRAGEPEIELAWSDEGSRRTALLHPGCHGVWLVAARSLPSGV